MESLIEAQNRLEAYEAVMDTKRRQFSQTRKERNQFKTTGARVAARSRSQEENQQLAERRKQRRIARDALKSSVAEVRRGVEALGIGYEPSTTPQGTAFRTKVPVDPEILKARKAKTAAFHEERNRQNFIKSVERAFEIAQDRIDDPSLKEWKLQAPHNVKDSWFPVTVVAFYLSKGGRRALTFESKRAYSEYHRLNQGFPQTEAMITEAEQQAARGRAEQRRRGAAEPTHSDDEEEIIEPITEEKGRAQQAYLDSKRKDRRREKQRVDRDTVRGNKPKHMRNARNNLARSYKGQSGVVGYGVKTRATYDDMFALCAEGKIELSIEQVLRAALEGQETAKRIVAFRLSEVKKILIEYAEVAPLVIYSAAGLPNRLAGSKAVMTEGEVRRRLANKKRMLEDARALGRVAPAKDDNYYAPLGEEKKEAVPMNAPPTLFPTPEPSAPPMPAAPAPNAPSAPPEDANGHAHSPVHDNKADSPPPGPAGKQDKSREGKSQKAKSRRGDMPETTETKDSKGEPLPEEKDYGPFVPSASPKTRCLFPYGAVPTTKTHFAYDPMGAPFCGYVAVDLAAKGKAESLEFYRDWCRNRALGHSGDIEDYARWRGFNLRIVGYDTFELGVWDGRMCPSHDTIFLAFNAAEGHYYLLAECCETNNNVNLPQVETTCLWGRVALRSFITFLVVSAVVVSLWAAKHWFGWNLNPLWFLQLFLAVPLSGIHYLPTIKFSPPFYNDNDRDVRLMLSRRDKLEMQASYSRGTLSRIWYLWGFNLCVTTTDRPRIVSLPRFHEIHAQAQILAATGQDPMKLMDMSLQYRGDNTDPSLPGVFRNTSFLACKLAQYVDGTVSSDFIGTRSTAYNSNASYVVAAEDKVRLFAARNATVGHGNCIMRANRKLTAIVGDPIAICALPIQSDEGQVGPGWYPRTDGASVVSAFALRSMAGPEAKVDRSEFVSWSKAFMSRFVSEVRLPPVEPSEEELYRRVSKGKKSQKQIESVLEEYKRYQNGARSKKFVRNGAFVKFENSGKLEDRYGVKPRLIMTMSELMAVQCAGVIEMIHAFNKTSFARFQVKEMTPEEMVNRIADASGIEHSVSDYSSFEASIDSTIREIENHVMIEALRGNGWYRTAEAIERYTKPRVLKTAEAIFRISTRCSGDYWTSFGNGVVNVCIMAYCAHLRGYDPYNINMIAEGDDGLVDARVPDRKVVNDLGFKYSVDLLGNQAGDVDFLRSRWVNGRRYLDIGRCFSATWLKNGHRLSKEKRAFLVRCVANSLYHLAPGHPVVSALVWRLRKDNPKWKHFRGYLKYLDVYSATGHKIFEEPENYKYFVCEDMRSRIAAGAAGFPPLSVATQIALERTIRFDKIPYVGSRLNEYGDFNTMVSSKILLNPWIGDDQVLRSILRVVNAEPNYVQARGVTVSVA